jgi:hypothetical protein
MNLIELLIEYRSIIQQSGREAANRFIHNSVSSSLWEEIEICCNEAGEFIDPFGEVINFP